jgi:hypothetical protein
MYCRIVIFVLVGVPIFSKAPPNIPPGQYSASG